ncbi:NADH dehydrogenase [ubiquinone] 1 alpha subcomplex subunit 5 [Candida viswanathii]|jgi:NADH dehydrogenase (ubiquinone) 1 alpha subcomplex subunit 5|uniref:NADH dehydrogenase [ubiquinone] 1 alpha subcomplex subunit 5 n=1 Tax=Candida viswanathii TaxID=5486 RepID=A0A367Y9X9_9ASCO|nr:NADH dehydrogenase [ubiquinone] 1 alpha subcomplex subunit 5 [Candida viswanathii]
MRFTSVLRQLPKVHLSEVIVRAGEGLPTGLAGLYKHPNPRPALVALYSETLKVLNDKFPSDSVYRQSVETLTKNRLNIVEKEEIVENIENQIGGGLIEEVVIQAAEELNLAKELGGLKVWEELEEKPLDDQWVYFGKKI